MSLLKINLQIELKTYLLIGVLNVQKCKTPINEATLYIYTYKAYLVCFDLMN